FLPLAHVFARMIQVATIEGGIVLGHSDIPNLLPDLASFQPTFLLAVPRVFEKVYNGAEQKAAAEGKGKIFKAAAETAIAYSRALDGGGPGIGRRRARGAARPLLPRRRHHDPGGLRPHRDDRPGQREPSHRAEDRDRRAADPGR